MNNRRANVTLQQRFDEKYIPEPFSGCWLWTGSLDGNGYGLIFANGRSHHAARIAWLLKHGEEVPKDLYACHRCDIRSCVNPDHIFLGTNSDNMMDAIKKGRKKYRSGFGKNWEGIRELKFNSKPTCKRGHLKSGDNLYINPRGIAHCRECMRIWSRAHPETKK